jgi:hypothetical protein
LEMYVKCNASIAVLKSFIKWKRDLILERI